MHQVRNTVLQFHMLEPGDRVLLGVSGGPDSVALLHLLQGKTDEYNLQLHVVHVNHMLRPEADEEAQYVEWLSRQYGVPFRLYKINVAEYAKTHKLSLEQAGHIVRFQCFEDAKKYWGINKLALGHHRDDRAESALLHLVQGCGLDGLCSMPPVDVWNKADDSYLIRPLANTSKNEIVQYCVEHKLRYYTDVTNLEPDFLRNRIRLELLPHMQKYNPQIAETLVRMQDIGSADLDYISQQIEQLWLQYGCKDAVMVQFPADVFCAQHIAVQRRLLRRMYQAWTGSTENLTYAQIEQMRSIALRRDGTQKVSLADGIEFIRQYQTIYMKAKSVKTILSESVYWDITIQRTCDIWNGTISVELDMACENQSKDYYFIYADLEKLLPQLEIRTRKPGDKIVLTGMAGHKSIKKFFIDKKIPQEEREAIPLVVLNGEIVWIPGLYMADSIRVTEYTKRICKLCFNRI